MKIKMSYLNAALTCVFITGMFTSQAAAEIQSRSVRTIGGINHIAKKKGLPVPDPWIDDIVVNAVAPAVQKAKKRPVKDAKKISEYYCIQDAKHQPQ